jgi:hypothetical protein
MNIYGWKSVGNREEYWYSPTFFTFWLSGVNCFFNYELWRLGVGVGGEEIFRRRDPARSMEAEAAVGARSTVIAGADWRRFRSLSKAEPVTGSSKFGEFRRLQFVMGRVCSIRDCYKNIIIIIIVLIKWWWIHRIFADAHPGFSRRFESLHSNFLLNFWHIRNQKTEKPERRTWRIK